MKVIEDKMKYEQLGSMHNYRGWIEAVDPIMLKDGCQALLEKSGYEVLNFIEHYFDPQGYTCLWLLAESHLAIHTFPEQGRSYIELSGCNQENNEVFMTLFNEWL